MEFRKENLMLGNDENVEKAIGLIGYVSDSLDDLKNQVEKERADDLVQVFDVTGDYEAKFVINDDEEYKYFYAIPKPKLKHRRYR
jgi:hypothetical protein